MKIPETSANVGAYYGNEENGQWQPNGVMMDSGVGGGVVGSGDAGLHRAPVYPVHHVPRPHVPGYVIPGTYYPPAAYPAQPQDDFADYMWMENEEEFDKQVMQQLEEEALMEQCIEAMLEDEQRERHRPVNGHNHHMPETSNGAPRLSLEETVSRSTLNPLAAEFVPTFVCRNLPAQEASPEKTEEPPRAEEAKPPEEPATPSGDVTDSGDVTNTTHTHADNTDESNVEETAGGRSSPPEVSAADVQPIADSTRKDNRPKLDNKKTIKHDTKAKVKPQTVKSDTKVQAKKKEVKVVKSDVKVEDVSKSLPVEVEKSQPSTPSEDTTPGIKPINYAAAAKANKPKKPSSPPATELTTPPPSFKPERKQDKPDKKQTQIKDKPIQRKNSAK